MTTESLSGFPGAMTEYEVVGIFLAKDDPIGFEERVLPVDPNVMLHHDQPVALADTGQKTRPRSLGFRRGEGR